MSVEVRRLTLNDAALAGELTLEYKRDAYAGILPVDRLDGLNLDHSVKLCKNLLKDSASNAIFVAFVNGEPAAMYAAGRLRLKKHVPPEYKGELHSLYVRPQFRRFRLADRLWSHVIDWLEYTGTKKAAGFVLEDNRAACAYMQLRGGRVIAVKEGDGFWAGHNILILAWDELRRPILDGELPELHERSGEISIAQNRRPGTPPSRGE